MKNLFILIVPLFLGVNVFAFGNLETKSTFPETVKEKSTFASLKRQPETVQSIESLHKLLVSYLKFCELNGITYNETVNNASITLEFLNWSRQIDAKFLNK